MSLAVEESAVFGSVITFCSTRTFESAHSLDTFCYSCGQRWKRRWYYVSVYDWRIHRILLSQCEPCNAVDEGLDWMKYSASTNSSSLLMVCCMEILSWLYWSINICACIPFANVYDCRMHLPCRIHFSKDFQLVLSIMRAMMNGVIATFMECQMVLVTMEVDMVSKSEAGIDQNSRIVLRTRVILGGHLHLGIRNGKSLHGDLRIVATWKMIVGGRINLTIPPGQHKMILLNPCRMCHLILINSHLELVVE